MKEEDFQNFQKSPSNNLLPAMAQAKSKHVIGGILMDQDNFTNEQEAMDEKETKMDHLESKDAMLLPNTSKDLVMKGNGDQRDDETSSFFRKGLFSGLFKDEGQDDVKDSPLQEACNLLKEWGVPLLLLKEGLLAVLGFNSARLGHPINFVLTEDEGVGAGELLNICRRLTPKDGVVEFLDIPDVSRHSLNGKTIFLSGYEGKNKKLTGLVRLLKYGTVPQSNLTKMKNVGELTEGPTALICFVKEKTSEIFDLPFLFHLHLTSPNLSNTQRALREESLANSNSTELEFNCLHMKALLSRLSPQEVSIPFFEVIANAINDKIHNNLEIIRFVKNVVKLVTIVNHFTPTSKEEMIQTYLNAAAGEGLGHVQESRALSPLLQGKGPFPRMLIATPYDYYCAKCLLDGIPLNSGEQLASRTFKVYEAIKNMNLDYLSASCEHLKSHEVLDTLEHPNHTRGWSGIRQIHTKVSEDNGETISESTVNKEVQFLLEQGYIQQREVARNPVKYVYAVKTLSVGPCSITLPDPKDLYNSASNGRILGRNPLTGAIEEI
ncbi:MAG: hypothetical protein WCO26_11565 [Deltaproteobacteria bacterium]